MRTLISAAAAAVFLIAAPAGGLAAAPEAPAARPPLPPLFVDFFHRWKARPEHFQVSELRVLDGGGGLRLLCGAYDLPGQARRPFLVLGDDKPSASAAWEPGSFPEDDPLYAQLMDNLRLCQRLGQAVTAADWNGAAPSV